MPFLRLTLLAPTADADAPSDASARADLAADLTALMETILRKNPALTSVLVERPVPEALWTIGGAPMTAAAHLEAVVTAGTNSASEKAAFIAAATARLRRWRDDLPTATYVVVREVLGEDWGYDGLTQAARRVNL